MMMSLLIAAGVAAAPTAADAQSDQCKDASRDEVLVCAKPTQRYRIDRSVLEASREHDAPPPKPAVTADAAQSGGCVGGQGDGCTGAGVIPLIGVAMVAAKAVALAANGDDWRDAIRTHEDEYRLYKEAEARRAKERKPRILFGVGN